MAKDAVTVAPHVYRVLLENDRVRVLDIRTQPGGTSEMHAHPASVIYAVSDCTWLLTSDSGEEVRAEVKAGQTLFQEACTHKAKDVGTTGSHAIMVELK